MKFFGKIRKVNRYSFVITVPIDEIRKLPLGGLDLYYEIELKEAGK